MADNKSPISSRNLVDSDLGILRKFTGILDSIPTDVQTYGEGDKKRNVTQAILNLKELEVIEAVEPYHFPIYSTRPLGLSNRKKSRWGVLMESFNSLVDPILYTPIQLQPRLDDGSQNPAYVKPADRMDFTACIGKRIGLVLADGEDGRPEPPDLFDQRANEGKGGDVPTPTWMIYSVEGIGTTGTVSGSSPLDLAMELLDGKTVAEFNKTVLDEPSVRENTELLQAIALPESAPKSFTATMISSGKFTKDKNEVYHKVAEEGK